MATPMGVHPKTSLARESNSRGAQKRNRSTPAQSGLVEYEGDVDECYRALLAEMAPRRKRVSPVAIESYDNNADNMVVPVVAPLDSCKIEPVDSGEKYISMGLQVQVVPSSCSSPAVMAPKKSYFLRSMRERTLSGDGGGAVSSGLQVAIATRMCIACGTAKTLQCSGPKRTMSCVGGGAVNSGLQVVATRVCMVCGTSKTPQWRTGPNGPKTLCNACGIRRARNALGESESLLASKLSHVRVGGSVGSNSVITHDGRVCASCRTSTVPKWRSGSLCIACGIRERRRVTPVLRIQMFPEKDIVPILKCVASSSLCDFFNMSICCKAFRSASLHKSIYRVFSLREIRDIDDENWIWPAQARLFFEACLKEGNAEAEFRQGMYNRLSGCLVAPDNGMHLLKSAGKKGHIVAAYVLAMLYLNLGETEYAWYSKLNPALHFEYCRERIESVIYTLSISQRFKDSLLRGLEETPFEFKSS